MFNNVTNRTDRGWREGRRGGGAYMNKVIDNEVNAETG